MKNNKSPLVSVLMPVYNGEKYLHEAIDSILNQSYTNYEFIIINDGSTDNTEKIILSYNDPRIIYVKNEKNLRLIKTLNKGIDLAKGEYIARMDADDISMPNRFEKQVTCFITNKEIDIVNTQYYLLDDDGKSYRIDKTNLLIRTEAVKYLSIFQTHIAHPAVMIRASILKRFKYLENETIEHIEDFDLWNRLFASGKCCYTIPDYLLYYRMNPTSVTNINGLEQNLKMNKITHSILKEQYSTDIDLEILMLLQGDLKICCFDLLKKNDKFLSMFFFNLKKDASVSASAYAEMIYWKNHKIFIICIKSFSKVNLGNKIGIVLFLISKIAWFKETKWILELMTLFSSKSIIRTV